MTSSLGNKLPEGETQEVNLCVNNYECKSILEFYLEVRIQMYQMFRKLVYNIDRR